MNGIFKKTKVASKPYFVHLMELIFRILNFKFILWLIMIKKTILEHKIRKTEIKITQSFKFWCSPHDVFPLKATIFLNAYASIQSELFTCRSRSWSNKPKFLPIFNKIRINLSIFHVQFYRGNYRLLYTLIILWCFWQFA